MPGIIGPATMGKTLPQPDVLVLGDHPSAYLAGALLKVKTKLRVVHSPIPGERSPDHLVLVNPRFFSLHALLAPLARKVETRAIFGTQFLGDDPAVHSEYRAKSTVVCVARYRDVRDAMRDLAGREGVELVSAKAVRIHRLDEIGVDVTVDSRHLHPKALVLAGQLPADQQRLLNMPEKWDNGVLHRYSFVRWKGTGLEDSATRPVLPMSLDLGGTLSWAWVIPGKKQSQLAIQQPIGTIASHPPGRMLDKWMSVLRAHQVLRAEAKVSLGAVESMDVPLAGALAHEGVANRTLLVGPAGGFYSASGEDIFPNCWSAVFAADVLKRALKERHLQDSIQTYRHNWRTTLGEYLRGIQQNLRFLLPLVYRNPVMTARLSEAILQGKSVVR